MNKIKLKRPRPAFKLFTLDHTYPKLTSENGCCVTEMLRVCKCMLDVWRLINRYLGVKNSNKNTPHFLTLSKFMVISLHPFGRGCCL